MEDTKSSPEKEQNADSLQEQIEEIIAGKTPAAAPKKSLRDFISEKMAEDKNREDR